MAKRNADTLLKQALAQIDETRFQVANTHGIQNRCVQFYINTLLNVKEAEIRGTPAYINRAIASAYQATKIAQQLLTTGQMKLLKRPSFSSVISRIFSRNQQSAPQTSETINLTIQDKADVELMLDNNDLKQPGLKQIAEFDENKNGDPQPKITGGILYKLQNKAQQPSRFKNYWQQRAIQWQEIKMKWSWLGEESEQAAPSFSTTLRQVNFGLYDPRSWVEVFKFVKEELSSSDTRSKFLAQMRKEIGSYGGGIGVRSLSQEITQVESLKELESYVGPALEIENELNLIPLSENIKANSIDHIEDNYRETKAEVVNKIEEILNKEHLNARFLNRDDELVQEIQEFADRLVDLINQERRAANKEEIPSPKVVQY